MITLVTSCGADYNRPWLFNTLGMLSCRCVALLEKTDDRPLTINTERVVWDSDRFYQHGKFLDHVPPKKVNGVTRSFVGDDVVILADADAVVQRNFDQRELGIINDLGDRVWVGPNMGPGQLGCQELQSLRLTRDIDETAERFGVTSDDLRLCPMYNWGLVGMTVKVWRRLRDLYIKMVGDGDPQEWFKNYSWMQYLLCVMLHVNRIGVVPMGQETHSHEHFGMPEGCGIKNRTLYYQGKRVLFAHFVQGVCY